MWSLIFALTIFADTCTVSDVRIVFLIDSSGSVIDVEGSFQRQLRVANSVLDTVRTIFAEHGESEKLHWGAIEFGGTPTTISNMHTDTGKNDTMDENLVTACKIARGANNQFSNACTTHYALGLEAAADMLRTEDTSVKTFIWFLTDGGPRDIEFLKDPEKASPNEYAPVNHEKVREFRTEHLDKHDILTVCSYLTPNAMDLAKAKTTLSEICDDRVHIGALGDTFDLEQYRKVAEEMFGNAVKTAAFVCEPAIWVTAALLLAVCIGALCCCCAGVKAKQHFFEEEETVMTQVYDAKPNRMRAKKVEDENMRRKVGVRKRT